MGRAGGAAVSKRKKELKNRKDAQFFFGLIRIFFSYECGLEALKKKPGVANSKLLFEQM
jgi:hypothetical protein